MPSRRTLLSAISAGAAVSVAGCLTDTTRVDAYIQFKSITGVLNDGGRRDETTIIEVNASYEPNREPPRLGHLDGEWADRFPVPRMPVVSDAVHEQLTERFDTVRYVVGTTSPEWAADDAAFGSFNVATTRSNFNRVQVHNRVTASSDGTTLTIHSVDGLWAFPSDE